MAPSITNKENEIIQQFNGNVVIGCGRTKDRTKNIYTIQVLDGITGENLGQFSDPVVMEQDIYIHADLDGVLRFSDIEATPWAFKFEEGSIVQIISGLFPPSRKSVVFQPTDE